MNRDRAYEHALNARDAAEKRCRDSGMPESLARDLSRKAAAEVEKSVTTSTTSTSKDKP